MNNEFRSSCVFMLVVMTFVYIVLPRAAQLIVELFYGIN